ncbi:hypothetical protein BS17DRAFT_152835 [Gyrodon lividus]|nr:hypothetical protein BS17DRAFT_152835 [Gyrodon lividus]
MAGFLRKKATSSKKRPTQLSYSFPPKKHSNPPSLPPLFVQYSPSTLVDPEPSFSLSSSSPADDPSSGDDEWNPWQGYAEAPAQFRLPAQPRVNLSAHMSANNYTQPQGKVTQPGRPLNDVPMSQTRARYLPAGSALPQSIKLSASNASSDAANTYYTAVSRLSPTEQSPRKTFTRQVREEQSLPPPIPPKDDVLGNKPRPAKPKFVSANVSRTSRPPTVVRGPSPPASSFDFEESLSAANVTSVVNQFRSYPPPTTRHQVPSPPASQDPQTVIQSPQLSNDYAGQNTLSKKPASSSSLSSSGNHTDATRRTNVSYGTASTSVSSIAPVTKVRPRRLDPYIDMVAFH